jgi:DNA-directed RNA polymerase subunit RPC12/RpoP
MIEFDCPECGAFNEVSDRKAGRRIRCRKCDERITVPDDRPRNRRDDTPKKPRLRDALSKEEYLLYGLLFFVSPGINVVVSSFLYFHWKSEFPTKAYQVNQLGWVVFGIQFLPLCMCCCLGAMVDRGGRERRF